MVLRSPEAHGARDEIAAVIAATAALLPTQGPIDVFVAQNILQGFEDRPFDRALIEASHIFDTEPFLPESTYREEMARGRIHRSDLQAVLDADLGSDGSLPLAGGRVTLREVFLALLEHPVHQEDDVAVRWTLTEREPFRGDDGQDLWRACLEAVSLFRTSVIHTLPPARPRDLIIAVDPTLDTDALVHPLLIRFCAAFLDQGVAAWPMPGRDHGLFEAVAGLHAWPGTPTEPWSGRLPAELAQLRGQDPLAVIAGAVDRLGVPPAARDEAVSRTLLALRGWAGMIHQLELRPDRAPVCRVPARLSDFLAVRMVMDRAATQWAATQLGHAGDLAGLWTELRDRYPPRRGPGSVARAFLLCQVARLVGLTAAHIRALDENELVQLERAVHGFDAVTRRRLFHLAYERRQRIITLDALAAHDAASCRPVADRPGVQAVFCMDDRCESFRRHLEEQGPTVETIGAAGFFFVPMYYRGIDDWHATPLCPIVVQPQHTVSEVPEATAVGRQHVRRTLRRAIGHMVGGLAAGSRTMIAGRLLTAIGGAIAAIPLVARVVFPRLTERLAQATVGLGRHRVATRLILERHDDHRHADGTLHGFTIEEMAEMIRRLLEDAGLTSRFARLVVLLGHGSVSLNNPHESAYDCGACGGGKGGANARACALMANDPRVRRLLAGSGLVIPDDTVFLGGMHDTCSNAVVLYDLDRVPESHREETSRFTDAAEQARAADAQERCRRFDSVPLDVTPVEALRRVEGRAADLAQVRPELGHATNAICIVGRRWRTRGLFLDRRAFLVSYDPDHDPDGAILTRSLAAVAPVSAGINLAYTLSRIDPIGYGCGTKLPHNITGLIGVMDGHASDLRTGLPWQTVEIHEPVRMLLVVEAAPELILSAAARMPAVEQLIKNRWVHLASWVAPGGGLLWFDGERFVAYQPESSRIAVVDRSVDWFAGHRGHLPPARTMAALTGVSR
ncbi:MAG: DUF2309 domain-containing protein [Planctomycetota bacterium]|nr:DUF2309 domain-containing protein [Planctomycetota bacterium]